MTEQRINTRRIDINYAAVQSSYWIGACAITGFTTVFLTYRGLSDTQIGLTSSLVSIAAIMLQILVANYCDTHSRVPLKRVIALLYIVTTTGCALMLLIPLPIALMILVYTIGSASVTSINGLLNAVMMQFVNIGVPVNYGWPRGMGSIAYAIAAYLFGVVIERYNANALLFIYIALAIISIASILLMPNPTSWKAKPVTPSVRESEDHATSYPEMLRRNPTLVLFLCACVTLSVGQSSGALFLIRIVESLGGGIREFGIGMFIQAGVELPIMFASGWVLSKLHSKYILSISFFCYFIKLLSISLAPSLGFIYAAMAFSIFCFGLYGFASVVFVNSIVGASEKVRAQSLVALCSSAGHIIGNFVSGYVIDTWGLSILLSGSWMICLFAALLMLLCCRVHSRFFSPALAK